MKKKSLLLQILLTSIVITGIYSCTADNTMANDPADSVNLNMLDERNGKTLLGTTDVYINKAYNFYTSSCLIAGGGKVGGLGAMKDPQLSNLVREAAVTPGHIYQVFDRKTVLEFQSGTRAIMIGASYYRLYVTSPITIDNNPVGATVKYVEVYPDDRGLPKFGSLLGELAYGGQSLFLDLPAGAELHSYSTEVFAIRQVDERQVEIMLIKTPTDYNGTRGDWDFPIRLGDVFTEVIIRVL